MKDNKPLVAVTLADFIKATNNGTQRGFASAEGVKAPQVTQWLTRGFIVVNGVLYSKRRDLKSKEEL